MKKFISKIWFPAVLTAFAAVQSFGIDAGRFSRVLIQQDSLATIEGADSVHAMDSVAADSLAAPDSVGIQAADSLMPADSVVNPADTIVVSDSLRYTDTLKFKYYIALKDSVTRAAVRDSLRSIGDSLELHRLDSLVYKDSTETAYRDSIAWFNSLSRREKKKYLAELETARKMVEMDSILARKDSIRA